MECKNSSKSSSPQIFLEDFKKCDQKSKPYFYGFGRHRPLNPFLFRAPKGPTNELFSHAWWDFPDNYQLSKSYINGLSFYDPSGVFERNQFFSLFSCAAEIFSMKISQSQSKCVICDFNGSQDKVIAHIIDNHSEELVKYLEPHSEYVDDDTEYMTGMFTKIQFDSMITYPKVNPKKSQYCPGFTAPIIDPDNSYQYDDDEEDYDDDDDEEDEIPINFYTDNSAANLEIDCIPHAFSPKISIKPKLTIKRFLRTPHIFFRGKKIPPFSNFVEKHVQKCTEAEAVADSEPVPSPATLLMPLLDMYIKSPQKTNPSKVIDSFDFDLNDYPVNNPKRKSKQPEMIDYIQTIPEQIRSTVISNLAKKFISDWVSTECLKIVKPRFKAKKKLQQKKLRDEKLNKARNEERQKLQAMRERRKLKIDTLSKNITEPFVRFFIRSEIESIFNQEVERKKELLEKNGGEEEKIKVNKDEKPPFVLYTNQKINLLIPTTRNIDKITVDGGKMINSTMIPVLLIDDQIEE